MSAAQGPPPAYLRRLPPQLVVKLCSALVHLDEYASPFGHPSDLQTAHAIMGQPEVETLLEQMRTDALLPLKRRLGP